MPEFFRNPPQAGKPISMDGLADGLNRLAEALNEMDVLNGRVDWSGFAPLIITPEHDSGGGGAGLPAVTSADSNKVLIVSSGGNWVVNYPRFHS